MKFTELDVHPHLLAAIKELEFEELTEIQQGVLQPGLEGKNIAGVAQTGTGKTIAFLLPILSRIFANPATKDPSALILTPTRELCLQITEEAEKLCSQHPTNICSLYGGQSYHLQEKQLAKNPQVVVATPGRLIDFMKQRRFIGASLKTVVLDEADRMLDMGFIRDIRFIMRQLPQDAQTMLFSATLPYSIIALARDYMDDVVEVRIKAESVAVERIKQSLLHLGTTEKTPYLVNQLHEAQKQDQGPDERLKVIIFTNFRHKVHSLTELLRKYGISAIGISSLLNQNHRMRLLKGFRSNEYFALVATDVASRGIDIDQVSHVFNYDLPQDPEAYVHRIGRTARAGHSGLSISYCCEADYAHLKPIENYIKQKIPLAQINTDFLQFPKNGFSPLPPLSPKKSKPRSANSSISKARPNRSKSRHHPEQKSSRYERTSSRSEQTSSRYKKRRNKGKRDDTQASSQKSSGHHSAKRHHKSKRRHTTQQRPVKKKTGIIKRLSSLFK